jgi:hypothetical protein
MLPRAVSPRLQTASSEVTLHDILQRDCEYLLSRRGASRPSPRITRLARCGISCHPFLSRASNGSNEASNGSNEVNHVFLFKLSSTRSGGLTEPALERSNQMDPTLTVHHLVVVLHDFKGTRDPVSSRNKHPRIRDQAQIKLLE